LLRPAAKRAEAKQAAQGQDFIMARVGNDNDLREVVPEEGRRAFTGVSKGAVVVVHTTALAEPRQNSSALLQR
jgi:3-hydroxyisobutyrate dehydrogenase